MADDEFPNLCTRCGEGDGSGPTGKCPSCLNAMAQEGWRVTGRHGVMVNRETGAKVTPSGRVTMTAQMNPRMMALLAGDIEPEDLDDDELARGMCRNTDGTWPRKAPGLVPKAMYDRMTKVLFERAGDELRDSLVEAAKAMAKLSQDENVDHRVRMQAATWLIERVMGKAPAEVKITQDRPFEHTLMKVTRGPRPPVAPGGTDG